MPIPPSPSRVLVRDNGVDVGKRGAINFTAASGVSRTLTDDPANNEVEVALSVSLPTGIGARVYNSGNISHASSGSWQALTFDSERYDTDAFHSTGSNTGRLTIGASLAGKYDLKATATFAANATGQRGLQLRVNGTTVIAEVLVDAAASGVTSLTVGASYALAAADYVELLAFQSSGGALNVSAVANNSPEFSIALEAATSGAPSDADYWVETANGQLSAETVIGTTGITTAAQGSRQAAAKAGRLFLPSDGYSLQRDTGSAWAAWGPLLPMTPPVLGDFAWVNQGAATAVSTNGGVYMEIVTDASSTIHLMKKAAPATPYVIDAAFIPLASATDGAAVGLVFRQSSDGKLALLRIRFDVGTAATFSVRSDKFTSTSAFSANYTTTLLTHLMAGPCLFLRIADNGTSRICSVSADGQNYMALHTVGRTDFLTANEVGFFVAGPVGSANVFTAMTLLSWREH